MRSFIADSDWSTPVVMICWSNLPWTRVCCQETLPSTVYIIALVMFAESDLVSVRYPRVFLYVHPCTIYLILDDVSNNINHDQYLFWPCTNIYSKLDDRCINQSQEDSPTFPDDAAGLLAQWPLATRRPTANEDQKPHRRCRSVEPKIEGKVRTWQSFWLFFAIFGSGGSTSRFVDMIGFWWKIYPRRSSWSFEIQRWLGRIISG